MEEDQFIESEFTLGFSNLIVWVENKPWCSREEPEKPQDSSFFYDEYQKSIDVGDSMEKIKESNEIDEVDENLKEKINKELLDEIKSVQREPKRTPLKDQTEIPILKGLNGIIPSGNMTAIMGSSGAGKTTLMNFLSSRSNWDPNMYVDGDLLVNGQKVENLNRFKNLIGFVPQEDILYENMTVRRNLEIYGQLRNVRNPALRAQELIKNFGLEKCADTVIGNVDTRGISGGERKRVCIAIEIVMNPKLIFLDEPTTGLDAFTAFKIIRQMKDLNRQKKAGVIAILHQPRQEIIDLFDQVRLAV